MYMVVCIFARLVPDLVPTTGLRTRRSDLVLKAGSRTRSRTRTHKVRTRSPYTRYAQGPTWLVQACAAHKVAQGPPRLGLGTRVCTNHHLYISIY